MSGDVEQQYFCDGMTEDIITELSRFRQMHVVSRNSSSRFRGTDIDMIRAGRELGVHYLVEGSVRRMGARIRITAQLIDAATGNHIWAERYDSCPGRDFRRPGPGGADNRRNARRAHEAAATEMARRKPPASLAAYEYVLRGDALPVGHAGSRGGGARSVRKGDRTRSWLCTRLCVAVLCARAGMVPRHERFRTACGTRRLTMAQKAVALDENDATLPTGDGMGAG